MKLHFLLFFSFSVGFIKGTLAQAVLEPCDVSPSCTRVSCRANLLGNTTQSTQELTVVFSVDPNCQQSADVFFALRDGNGLSLSNQSFVDCFSILQQDRLEVTLGPLPEDVEAVTFSLNQETNETTVLTLTVPGEPNPPLLRLQTTWFHQLEQCPDPTTTMAPTTVTTGGAESQTNCHLPFFFSISIALLFSILFH